MASPMTLVIPMKEGADMQKLAGILVAQQDAIDAARVEIGTLHYARFVIFDHSSPNLQPQAGSTGPFSLAVITDYDGDFNVYIQDFVNHLGPAFSLLLSYSTSGQDLLPLNEHVEGFIEWIRANDASQHPPNDALRFFSAYPDTVQQVLANSAG